MNGAQIHLALNHFPIAGTFLALIILLWGFFSKKEQIKTVGIALIIISAASPELLSSIAQVMLLKKWSNINHSSLNT